LVLGLPNPSPKSGKVILKPGYAILVRLGGLKPPIENKEATTKVLPAIVLGHPNPSNGLTPVAILGHKFAREFLTKSASDYGIPERGHGGKDIRQIVLKVFEVKGQPSDVVEMKYLTELEGWHMSPTQLAKLSADIHNAARHRQGAGGAGHGRPPQPVKQYPIHGGH